MKFTKKEWLLLLFIVVVLIVGIALNTVTGHAASNKSFAIPIVVALVMLVGVYFYRKR